MESFSLSPDESLIAIERSSEIRVLTFPEGKEVTRWEMPWPLESWTCRLHWHPDGKTIMAALHAYDNQAGICLFHIERAEATHVFNLTRPWCIPMLSPDGSRLIVSLDCSMRELWLLDIDSTKSLTETLAPCLTRGEFLAGLLEKWNLRISADALNTKNYVSRALVHLAAKDHSRARQDLEHCATLIKDANDPIINTLQFWAEMYFESKRYSEAELLALQNAQLAERFPERFQSLPHGNQHPFQQLAFIYAFRGDKPDAVKWRKMYQQITRNVLAPQSMSYDEKAGQYTLAGSGMDIWDTWDEFHFALKRLQGDGSIIAMIESINHTHDWAKAGLMIRNSLEPAACNAAVLVTPAGRAIFQYRRSDFQETVGRYLDSNSIELPHWIKLERKGNSFTAQHSVDGLYWEDIAATAQPSSDSVRIEMNEQVYIGMALTSHAGPEIAAHAGISNVRVTGSVTPSGPFTESQYIGYSFHPVSATDGVKE